MYYHYTMNDMCLTSYRAPDDAVHQSNATKYSHLLILFPTNFNGFWQSATAKALLNSTMLLFYYTSGRDQTWL